MQLLDLGSDLILQSDIKETQGSSLHFISLLLSLTFFFFSLSPSLSRLENIKPEESDVVSLPHWRISSLIVLCTLFVQLS